LLRRCDRRYSKKLLFGYSGHGCWGTEKFAEKLAEELVDMMKKSSADQSSA
jgi:hypothetical protein